MTIKYLTFCPLCRQRYPKLKQQNLHSQFLKQKELEKIKKWIMKNIRKGSYVLIGQNYRKVLQISNGTTLTLKKIRPTGYNRDVTVYVFADYYKKLKGVRT